MIEETGTVVEVADNELVVAVVRTSACQSCKARQGCGQAVLSEWGDRDKQAQKNHFRIPYDQPANIGDQVVLAMAHDAVSKVALLVYIAPLLAGFIGMFFAAQLAVPELAQLAIFMVLFLAAVIVISRLKVNKSSKLVPEIVRLSPPSKDSQIIASSAVERV